MSIQFAGSKSSDERRRRRLVVNADDPGADGTNDEEGLSAPGVTSELVASSAAAPWVPVHEWRIWTYAALISLVLTGAAFALAMPRAFRSELAPLTRHLLQGERPVLAVLIQTTFCILAAQLAILIGWYRAQCKLDFRGYYRVWPWVTVVLTLAAICSASDAHVLFGQIVGQSGLLTWRAGVVAWLLPASLAALPLVILLDRDVRRSRSSLYTLRVTWVLAIASAWLELFAADLQSVPQSAPARVILPMFVMASLFVGLWFHARTVAYVCPDPPELTDATATTHLLSVWRYLVALRNRRRVTAEVDAEESKPKRGRKKAATTDGEEDEAAPKRKRRAPAKRVAKPRTRVKIEEEEVEEEEESADADNGYESPADEADSGQWEEEEAEQEAPPPAPVRSQRDSNPAPQSAAAKRPTNSDWDEPEEQAQESDEDEDSEDAILRRDTGMTAEQMKGLSKRQKRELRRQQKTQRR